MRQVRGLVRMAPGALLLGVVVALAGCTETPAEAGGGEPEVVTVDAAAVLDTGENGKPDTGPRDAGPDSEVVQDECGGPPPACLPTDGASAGHMCPCDTNADCDSGLCVATPDGRVCTTFCTECCPDGFVCGLLGGVGVDTKYACLPAYLNLCRPCTTNGECANPAVPKAARCVDFGPEGSFCGDECSDDEDCPASYSCQDVTAVDGAAVRQCVPTDGICACSALAIGQGAATTCSAANEVGTCTGSRSCTADGLSACTATMPGVEVCNGKDDDCNGMIDDNSCPEPGVCNCVGDECSCGCPEGTTLCDGECVDTMTSGAHCGGCNSPCELPNVATAICDEGQCKIYKCEAGWEDLDSEVPSGCECQIKTEICDNIDNDCDGQTDEEPDLCSTFAGCDGQCLEGQCVCPGGCDKCFGTCVPPETYETDPSNCGFCGVKCSDDALPNVSAYVCEGGQCNIGKCQSPWVNTNGESFDGCECQKTATIETCDGIDNDCDGVIDDYTEPCSTGCGVGVRKCTDGEWGDCDAQKPKICKDWGSCVDVEMCVDQCPTAPAEVCNAIDDNCNVTVDEGFPCVPGELMEEPCAQCGTQKLVCDETCGWEPLGGCQPGGICEPGALDQQACGKCGTRSRTCSDACGWDTFGECQGEGVCTPGETQSEACGACGQRTRTCTESCGWGEWTGCSGEGACQPGDIGTQSCGNCGTQSRTCGAGCGWGEWSSCSDQGVCAPGDDTSIACGNCGTQARTCSASCEWQDVGSCTGQGVCAPGTDDAQSCGNCGAQTRTCTDQCTWTAFGACTDGGQCGAGDVDTQACGACGTRSRSCSDACIWGEFGSCGGEGVCTPGEIQTDACGNCGTRSRTCTAGCTWGAWTGCSDQGVCSPGETDNQGCGTCGNQTRTCTNQCSWGGWSSCGGQGICSPGQTESESCGDCGTRTRTCTASCGWGSWGSCGGQGVCTPGDSDTDSCGDCGSRTRTCTNQCTWGSYGSCGGQGVCSPGEEQTQGCGNCGTRTRTCSGSCGWGGWSACTDQGVCAPGDTNTQSCGNCGSRTRTCTNQCSWGSYGSCGGQGVCSPGATQDQACGNCGTRSRTCSNSCSWSSYGSCGGQGECSPGASEACPLACGNRTCGATCGWNACNFTLDQYEPNDNYAQATFLGTIKEESSIGPVTAAWLHQAEPGFATPGEIDRFYFNCNESGDIFDWGMEMGASLSGVGGWHSLCIFYDRDCNGGVDAQDCASGYGVLSVNTGDVDDNDGGSDDGCIDIEVYGDASCSPYTLQLSCE